MLFLVCVLCSKVGMNESNKLKGFVEEIGCEKLVCLEVEDGVGTHSWSDLAQDFRTEALGIRLKDRDA